MKSRRGSYAKILLTVCGEVSASFVSSTPLVKRRPSAHKHSTSFCQTLLGSAGNNNEKSLRPTLTGKRGRSYDESEEQQRSNQGSSPKKCKMSMSASQNDWKVLNRTRDHRAEYPSKRWNHTMCLCDPDTAVLIGGETTDNTYCTDSIWKLEIDGDFWFSMTSSAFGPLPPSSQGQSVAFDPENKVIYVYGGFREGQHYSDIYMLDTLTWKWKLIKTKGNIPSLAYHSCCIYKSELYVFGGLQPSRGPQGKDCSNALYIFNPEHELWYQPIVEGDRPLPRFGHSCTLLPGKLVIFGGQKTAVYLNDLCILDLGFMEYTAVKYESLPPLARGFHAALPLSDNRLLISGGCSALGALQDLHLFNLETSCWTSVVCPLLCSKPRAGHSLISLTSNDERDQEMAITPAPQHSTPF